MGPGLKVYAKGDNIFAMTAFEPLHDVTQVAVVRRVKGIGSRRVGTEISLGIIHVSNYVCIRLPTDDEIRIGSGRYVDGFCSMIGLLSLSPRAFFPSKFSGLICLGQWPTKRWRSGTCINNTRNFGKRFEGGAVWKCCTTSATGISAHTHIFLARRRQSTFTRRRKTHTTITGEWNRRISERSGQYSAG